MTSQLPDTAARCTGAAFRAFCAFGALLSLSAFATAQTSVVQEKIFYNSAQTDSTTRVSSTTADTIYFMQPELFRKGYGAVRAFRALLQDADYNTSEAVGFGAVRYGTGDQPDTSAAGVITAGTASLMFPQPATGTVSAAIWTITLAQPVAAPSEFGLRLVLPIPASASDGASVHTQRDTTTKLPMALRKQWTFTGAGASAYFGAGTTLRYGAIYDEPVSQIFIQSTLYGASEDLYGPEALHPDPAAGDKVAWHFRGSNFGNQVAVLLIDGQLRQTPIQATIGTLFLQVPLGLIQLPLVLDAMGEGKTASVLPPAKVALRTQAVFVNLSTGAARASDCQGIVAQ